MSDIWNRESWSGHAVVECTSDDEAAAGEATFKLVVGFSHLRGVPGDEWQELPSGEAFSYSFVAHTITAQTGKAARWASAQSLVPDATLPELGRSKLVCFEVSPVGDLGIILWREPTYTPHAAVGESLVYELDADGEYTKGTGRERLLTGTFFAQDDLRLGYDEVQEWVSRFTILSDGEAAALQQGGWCLKMSNSGCELAGDPATVQDIMSNQSMFTSLVKAAVTTVLMAPGGYPLAAVEKALQRSGMLDSQIPRENLREYVIEALQGNHVGLEKAAELEQLARAVSAEMSAPVGIAPFALAGHTLILRRGAVGVVMNVTETAIPGGEDLEELLLLLQELDGPAEQMRHIIKVLEPPLLARGEHLTASEVREAILEALGAHGRHAQFREWLLRCDRVVEGLYFGLPNEEGGGRLSFISTEWVRAYQEQDLASFHAVVLEAVESFSEAGGSFEDLDPAEMEQGAMEELIIADAEFASPPGIDDVHKLFVRRILGPQRKQLLRNMMQHKDGDGQMSNEEYATGKGLSNLLEDAALLLLKLGGRGVGTPQPTHFAPPEGFTISLAQRVIDVRYALCKRLAVALTFAVLPNVRVKDVRHAPLGLAKHRLTETVQSLRSLFIARRLAHIPVSHGAGREGSDDTLSLSDVAGERSSLPCLLLRTSGMGHQIMEGAGGEEHEIACTLRQTALALAKKLTIWDVESSGGSMRGEIVLCCFLKEEGQYDALEHYLGLLGQRSPAFLYFKAYASLAQAYRLLLSAGLAFSPEEASEMRVHAGELYKEAVVAFMEAAPTALRDASVMEALRQAGALVRPREGSNLEAPHWFELCSYYLHEARGTLEELRRHKQWMGCHLLARQAVLALTGALEEESIGAGEDAWIAEYLEEAQGETVPARVWMSRKLDEVRLQYFEATVELLKSDPFGDLLSEAYTSVYTIANIKEQKSAMRSVVKALVPRSGRRNIRALCGLPFVGFQEEVEGVLWLEARQMDVHEMEEGYYHVLHAWFTSRKNYRGASHAMLEYALRLMLLGRQDSAEDLRRQMGGFLAAANALRLVKEEAPEEGKWNTQANSIGGRYVVIDVREQAPASKRKRKMGGGSEEHEIIGGEQRKARVVVSLQDLEKWCAVSTAYVALSELPQAVLPQASRHRAVEPPPTDEVVQVMKQLRRHKLYEEAARVGTAYELPLEPVLEDLATYCVQTQRSKASAMSDESISATKGSTYELSDSPPLQLLCRLLMECDGKKKASGEITNFSLHFAVMDRLLTEDAYIGFPAPLLASLRACAKRSARKSGKTVCDKEVSFFEQNCQLNMATVSVLLGLVLRHPSHAWLQHDAAGIVIQALRGLQKGTANKGYFPFSLLDRFMSLLLHTSEMASGQTVFCSKSALRSDYENIRKFICHDDYLAYEEARQTQPSHLAGRLGQLEWPSSVGTKEGLDSEASWRPRDWSWEKETCVVHDGTRHIPARQQLYW